MYKLQALYMSKCIDITLSFYYYFFKSYFISVYISEYLENKIDVIS